MNTAQRQLRLWMLLLSFALLLSLQACRPEPPVAPSQEDFSRKDLEQLGDRLRDELLAMYDILPETSPYDTTVYWLAQSLYNQATSTARLDKQSAPDNRWSQDRAWKVYLIADASMQHIFALPGGDLFISTGLLKKLEKEYELYALMSFEVMLMQEGRQLEQLILQHNSLTLQNIIQGTGGETTAGMVAEGLPSLAYDPKITKSTDAQAIENICQTSILDPTGLAPFLENTATESSDWRLTRPSYDGRIENIHSQAVFGCGSSLGTGYYQRFVLDVL